MRPEEERRGRRGGWCMWKGGLAGDRKTDFQTKGKGK